METTIESIYYIDSSSMIRQTGDLISILVLKVDLFLSVLRSLYPY